VSSTAADDLQRIATEAITPKRRGPVPSSIVWDSRASLPFHEAETLAYWSSGSGPPVLLVHGWEGSHADLDAFVGPLLAAGLRVVAVDLPGHGESTGTVAAAPDLGNAVVAIGEALGPLAGIIGHSAGSPAVAYALLAGLRTSCAVLIASPERYERYLRWYAQEAGVDGDALIEVFASRGIDVPSLVLSENAAGIDLPALIVHSNDDRTCDVRNAHDIAAAWRGSELLLVDGLGHNRLLRDPAVVEAVVDFVARSATT
jgi:pimeloyl-ACP methyl ester carboxylesterase